MKWELEWELLLSMDLHDMKILLRLSENAGAWEDQRVEHEREAVADGREMLGEVQF